MAKWDDGKAATPVVGLRFSLSYTITRTAKIA
jgi:hypothetical protein